MDYLLEVKLPYDPVCPSVGRLFSRLVISIHPKDILIYSSQASQRLGLTGLGFFFGWSHSNEISR